MTELNGRLIEGTFTSEIFEPGTVFPYCIFVPAEYDGRTPAALIVEQDGLCKNQAYAMQKLTAEGNAPVCIIVGIDSGYLPASLEGGFARGMRDVEYDQPGRGYPDFVIEEFLPNVLKQENLIISPEANMHMISGGSSGGCCAWNAVWFRNDFFCRAFLSSPSFLAMRGMDEYLTLIRKTETHPIRVYVTVASNEPDDYFGSSYVAGIATDRALKYAGYDYAFDYIEGGGHCAKFHDSEYNEHVLRFLWKDWKKPIRPLRFSQRIQFFLDFDSAWQETNEMPKACHAKTAQGIYSFEGGKITFNSYSGNIHVVADDFDEISALAISSDRWRLYIADRTRRNIYVMSICPDGGLKEKYIFAPLHLAFDCRTIGASDLCVDTVDRVYAATELGVQTITSFGIVDSIIPLPHDLPAEKIAFGGENNEYLYVKSGIHIFRRKLKVCGKAENDVITKPANTDYYSE